MQPNEFKRHGRAHIRDEGDEITDLPTMVEDYPCMTADEARALSAVPPTEADVIALVKQCNYCIKLAVNDRKRTAVVVTKQCAEVVRLAMNVLIDKGFTVTDDDAALPHHTAITISW
jgi:hypothetical protein